MSKRRTPPTGELRRSQLITSYGPGAMVDLPGHSVLVGGLETWQGPMERVHEERLEGWLQTRLGVTELELRAPPIDSGDPGGPRTGVTVYPFPGWFLGQVDETWTDPDGRVYRTRPLIHREQLVRGGYLDHARKVRPVVPVRFVQACVRGHLSDIDWRAFLGPSAAPSGELWFDEGGTGNDFAEIFVRCGRTGHRRPLSDASVTKRPVLGTCRGRQPWLGPYIFEPCDRPNRLLTRSASNAWFSQTMSVIAIPDGDRALKDAVNRVYDPFLMGCEDPGEVKYERKKAQVASALEGFTNEAVWAEVERRRRGLPAPEKGIKGAELETLLSQRDGLGDDQPEGDFYARNHPLGALPAAAAGKVDKLVLVHRLREVVVQAGFTRFEASTPEVDGELDLKVERAPLSRELRWLPAIENRGEGVFLSFAPEAIDRWLGRAGVRRRAAQLLAGFEVASAHRDPDARFPGLPYIMLHSLAHLLITALSLDCGYSASSIRERVYASREGYGILLYTGSPGSEGTLGGLVDAGRDMGRHLARALELGRLCSNDPVCAQHAPNDPLEGRPLHGAACHGCLLTAETSCERRNELLDRALVVPVVGAADAAFFVEGG